MATGQLKVTLHGGTAGYVPLVFSPDSKTLVTGSNVGVQLWDVASGQLETTLQGVRGLAFSPDSKTLATGSYDSNTGAYAVRLWE